MKFSDAVRTEAKLDAIMIAYHQLIGWLREQWGPHTEWPESSKRTLEKLRKEYNRLNKRLPDGGADMK